MRSIFFIVVLACGRSGEPPPAENTRRTEQPPTTDSPYKACIRASMQSSFDDARARGVEPHVKRIEELAIFACEAENNCVGQDDCDQKMRLRAEQEKQALERWK